MPFSILECRKFVTNGVNGTIVRTTCHYELDLYLGGRREASLDSEKFEISEGSLVFRRPGQIASGTGDYNCYVSTLDFSNSQRHGTFTRQTPDSPEAVSANPLVCDIPTVFRPSRFTELKTLFASICNCADIGCNEAKLCMKEILHLINAELCHRKISDMVDCPEASVLRYINENYASDISLDCLSRLACLDKSYLIRTFKAKYGVTPIEYLINYRLGQARALISNTNLTISEIAYRCGYKTVSHFISQYKDKYGKSPGHDRDSIRGGIIL